MKIVVLAGGVGAARFLEGMIQVLSPEDISVIVNTGDDDEFFGLHVSPDIDTILYTLSGKNNEILGWGLQDETFVIANELKRLGHEMWFTLGDKDLATHMHRTALLDSGLTLTAVIKDLTGKFGLAINLLPMTDGRIRTMIKIPDEEITFQEYFVKRKHADKVIGIRFSGIEKAVPAPGVIELITKADAIIFAPSNPFVSIGSILAVPGIQDAIKKSKAKKIGISPIVGGKAIKGPAATMLRDLGMDPSSIGVAKHYSNLLDIFLIDNVDSVYKEEIEKLGLEVVVTNTIMKNNKTKKNLAEKTIEKIH